MELQRSRAEAATTMVLAARRFLPAANHAGDIYCFRTLNERIRIS
jgi:hypothetical protein